MQLFHINCKKPLLVDFSNRFRIFGKSFGISNNEVTTGVIELKETECNDTNLFCPSCNKGVSFHDNVQAVCSLCNAKKPITDLFIYLDTYIICSSCSNLERLKDSELNMYFAGVLAKEKPVALITILEKYFTK